jgi:hypothetical protein
MRIGLAGKALIVAAALALSACATPRSSSWITLFDGSSLERWDRIGASNWRIEQGAATADQGNKAPSYLVSRDSYGDFELRVEFWSDAPANSGVFIRCADPRKVGANDAYEIQIADSRTDGTGTGSITNLAKVIPPRNTLGQWNTFVITARGPELNVVLNGVQTASARDSKYARGPIALQHITGTVKFRKVEIRPL